MWTLRCFNTCVHRCSLSWVELSCIATDFRKQGIDSETLLQRFLICQEEGNSYVCLKLCCWHRRVTLLQVKKRSLWRKHFFSLFLKPESSSSSQLSHCLTFSTQPVPMLFHWELFLQWCLHTVEVTSGVFHKVFHQVFLQLLFLLCWMLARRGHFKISKKKKKCD